MAHIKLEHADEYQKKVISLCFAHCALADASNLMRIGAYLGDFANNLRSALNYAMHRFVQNRLTPVLLPNEYRKIERHQDFPGDNCRTSFDQRTVIRYIRKHCLVVYQFLEGVQPYHPGNEWLKYLLLISNKDKHVIENEIRTEQAGAVLGLHSDGTPHPKPAILGDKLFVMASNQPHIHPLPCYYTPYDAFALKGGKWSFFHIMIDEKRLSLMEFLRTTPRKIEGLINDLEAFI